MDTFAAAMVRRRSSSVSTTLGIFSHKRSDSVSSITPATTPEAKAAEGTSHMDANVVGVKKQVNAVVLDSSEWPQSSAAGTRGH